MRNYAKSQNGDCISENFLGMHTKLRWICENSHNRQEGCALHWKNCQRISCKQCSRPTASMQGMCNLHANKHHSKAYYYWKKLTKMVQNVQTPELLLQSLNETRTFDASKSWP